MKRIKGQTGMSLIEATIILLVLMLLTAVLAPSIFDYYHDAQSVKVKEDCEAIGLTVARLTRDVGPCLKIAAGDCTVDNRADVLYSDTGLPAVGDFIGAATGNMGAIVGATQSWVNQGFANYSPMVAQFTTNLSNGVGPVALYPTPAPAAFLISGPAFGLGWRGAYLASPIGPDPWGKPYLVNSEFLAPIPGGVAGGPEGSLGWNRDVFCLSAGINTQYETFFGGSWAGFGQGTERGGDDFIYVISGATR